MIATVRLLPDGPLEVRGEAVLETGDGQPLPADRLHLCRCGASARLPLCDGSHGVRGATQAAQPTAPLAPDVLEPGVLRIRERAGGPLKLSGPHRILDPEGRLFHQGTESALCRCGRSAQSPFCDGSHRNP